MFIALYGVWSYLAEPIYPYEFNGDDAISPIIFSKTGDSDVWIDVWISALVYLEPSFYHVLFN